MHPFLVQLGRFQLPTYGVVALCALGVAVLLVRRYARREGLPAGPTAEAIVLITAVGFFGARLFEALLHWDLYFARPGGLLLLLRSTGSFSGGLITAIPFGIYWFRRTGIPVLAGLDLLALVGVVAEGVGRFGCFFSGCCWGVPTTLPWAVTFPETARRLHPGLPEVPIHPTQIYLALVSLSILGVLLLAYRRKRFDGRILLIYLALTASSRFFLDFLRGDLSRSAAGGRLTVSQLLAGPLLIGTAIAYVWLARSQARGPTGGRRVGPSMAALAIGIAASALRPCAAQSVPRPSGFPVRIVEVHGDPFEAATKAHLSFCRELGYNAVWIHSRDAGAWTRAAAPTGPSLDARFLALARWCRRHGLDVWVSIDPVTDSPDTFFFTDEEAVRRLLAFAGMLHAEAGAGHLVLSFDDQPAQLRELSDIFQYGASAAPAQLALVSRLAATLPDPVSIWLRASAYCDAHLGDGTSRFAQPFLAGLRDLPARIGIVWTGGKPRSPTITRRQLEEARARLGHRPLLLDDGFPDNDNEPDDAMALVLGALRGREPGVRDAVDAYLTRPETPLAGSRLSLLTIASYLADPDHYDADKAALAAVARLAGSDRAAKDALTTQQMEWGGFIDGRNYWPRDTLNPTAAAARLLDPAFVESFTWTVSRYPGRMEAIGRISDRPFRDDLLRAMRRRLVVGRILPSVIEYFARKRAGRSDAGELLSKIADERQAWHKDADASRILSQFLSAADVPEAGGTR